LNEVRQDALNLVREANLKVGREGGNLDDESLRSTLKRSTFQHKDVFIYLDFILCGIYVNYHSVALSY